MGERQSRKTQFPPRVLVQPRVHIKYRVSSFSIVPDVPTGTRIQQRLAARAGRASAPAGNVDVTDVDAVREALKSLASEITVLVHGAGVLADSPIADHPSPTAACRSPLVSLGHLLGAKIRKCTCK